LEHHLEAHSPISGLIDDSRFWQLPGTPEKVFAHI